MSSEQYYLEPKMSVSLRGSETTASSSTFPSCRTRFRIEFVGQPRRIGGFMGRWFQARRSWHVHSSVIKPSQAESSASLRNSEACATLRTDHRSKSPRLRRTVVSLFQNTFRPWPKNEFSRTFKRRRTDLHPSCFLQPLSTWYNACRVVIWKHTFCVSASCFLFFQFR